MLMQQVDELKQHAYELGFDAIGICGPIAPVQELARQLSWLTQGYGNGLAYLSRKPERRFDARTLLPSCRSVIAVALSYFHEEQLARATCPPKVARYAQGEDYHKVTQEKLECLAAWLMGQFPGLEWKATVDSSPIAEKAFAISAGIGWRGKHSLLLNHKLGSYFVLGLLLVSIELPHDSPPPERCGTCRRCIDACPTGALVHPFVLNATRCISYLTTAQSGEPGDPDELSGWFYGCDACQQACPYNAQPLASREPRFMPRAAVTSLTWETILAVDDTGWLVAHAGTELGHRKLDKLKRAVPSSADSSNGAGSI